MKRTLSTRLTAFLLVLCMLCALIPVGFASDSGKDYVFDMGRLRYGQ